MDYYRVPSEPRRVWPAIGREAEIWHITAKLNTPDDPGVMIIGEHGIGKSWVVRNVIAAMDQRDVYTVRATPMLSNISLGVLGPLLTFLDEHPHDAMSALHALARYFRSMNPERRPVLYVQSAEFLDDASAMVVSQLVVSQLVTLVATSITGAHPELMGLVHSDGLSVMSLKPLPAEDVRTITCAYLRDPVCERALSAIVNTVQGNPFWLREILDEWLASGHLIWHVDTWVLSANDAEIRHDGYSKVARMSLARLSATQREVVELVAMIEPIEWTVLADIVGADHIDELIAMRVLSVSGRPARLRFSQKLMGNIVRSSMPMGRQVAICARLSAQIDRADLSLCGLERFVDMDLACGNAVTVDDAVEVAELALSRNKAAYALDILAAATSPADNDLHIGWHVLRARALAAVAGSVTGENALEKLVSEHDLSLDEVISVHLGSAAIARSDGDADGADHMIADAIFAMNGDAAAGPRSMARLQVIQLASAVEHETFHETMPALESLMRDKQLENITRVYAATSLADCLLMTGQNQAALEVQRWLVHAIEHGRRLTLDVYWRAAAVCSAILVEAGQWEEAMNAVERIADRTGGCELIDRGVIRTTAASVALRHGAYQDAADHLEAAIASLETIDGVGLHAHTVAMAGFAYVMLGNPVDAEQFLQRAERLIVDTRAPAHIKTEAQIWMLAARLAMPRATARAQLASLAEQSRIRGNAVGELYALWLLAKDGDATALKPLAERGECMSTPAARVFATFATAALSNDCAGLASAADMAESAGMNAIATRIAQIGLRILDSDSTNKSGTHHVRTQLYRCDRDAKAARASIVNNDGRRPIDHLTGREREIVRYVASGVPNREIAKILTVSTRTVEGHLYRIYPKLGVSGRRELKDLVVD